MKYIKNFEKINNTIHYKIPAYPLEAYFIALTKIGMSQDEISNWSSNKLAQYWNNSNFKFIYLDHIYNDYTKKYQWSWSNRINVNQTVREITVDDYEIDAKKFNI